MDLGWVGMTQVWSEDFKVDFKVVGLQGRHQEVLQGV